LTRLELIYWNWSNTRYFVFGYFLFLLINSLVEEVSADLHNVCCFVIAFYSYFFEIYILFVLLEIGHLAGRNVATKLIKMSKYSVFYSKNVVTVILSNFFRSSIDTASIFDESVRYDTSREEIRKYHNSETNVIIRNIIKYCRWERVF
jgi:hypothetical protein